MALNEIKKSLSEKFDEILPDRLVHSVSFDHSEDVLEITYADLGDQADGMGMIKTVALQRDLFATEISEIESDLRDLIDEVLTSIRNPDAHKARMDRAIARSGNQDDEDDDD